MKELWCILVLQATEDLQKSDETHSIAESKAIIALIRSTTVKRRFSKNSSSLGFPVSQRTS
ncbi:hypothetical protein OIU76_014947, partial [Salix suchowensis]